MHNPMKLLGPGINYTIGVEIDEIHSYTKTILTHCCINFNHRSPRGQPAQGKFHIIKIYGEEQIVSQRLINCFTTRRHSIDGLSLRTRLSA